MSEKEAALTYKGRAKPLHNNHSKRDESLNAIFYRIRKAENGSRLFHVGPIAPGDWCGRRALNGVRLPDWAAYSTSLLLFD